MDKPNIDESKKIEEQLKKLVELMETVAISPMLYEDAVKYFDILDSKETSIEEKNKICVMVDNLISDARIFDKLNNNNSSSSNNSTNIRKKTEPKRFKIALQNLKNLLDTVKLSPMLYEDAISYLNILTSNKSSFEEKHYTCILIEDLISKTRDFPKYKIPKIKSDAQRFKETLNNLANLLETIKLSPMLYEDAVKYFDILDSKETSDEEKHYTCIMVEDLISKTRDFPIIKRAKR